MNSASNTISSFSSEEKNHGSTSVSLAQSILSKQAQKEFTVVYSVVQTWFIRSSWSFKMKTLLDLLMLIRNTQSLQLLLNTLYSASGKAFVYTESQYCPKAIFDKPLNDHNRAMHTPTLINEQKNTLAWFSTLSNEDQVTVFIGLLRLAGGFIIRKMYHQAVKVYQKRLKQKSVEDRKKEEPWFILRSPYESLRSDYSASLGEKPKFTVMDENFKTQFNPDNPYTKEVLRHQKLWDDAIKKYQVEIKDKQPPRSKLMKDDVKHEEDDSKKVKGKSGKKGSKKASEKSSEMGSNKLKSSNKSDKNKKTKKDAKKDLDDVVDQLQMLPVWITKMILNMLDNKSLQVARQVNSYWDYVIGELIEERKVRQKLDKEIEIMSQELEMLKKNYGKPIERLRPIKHCKIGPTEKRLLKLFRRGAVHPKLQPIVKHPMYMQSIFQQSIAESPDSYSMPLHFIQSFPRQGSLGATRNFTESHRSCILHESYYDPEKSAADKLKHLKEYDSNFVKQDSKCKFIKYILPM